MTSQFTSECPQTSKRKGRAFPPGAAWESAHRWPRGQYRPCVLIPDSECLPSLGASSLPLLQHFPLFTGKRQIKCWFFSSECPLENLLSLKPGETFIQHCTWIHSSHSLSFVVSVHIYWMPLGNSPTCFYVLFLEIFKLNFPFHLGDRPCGLFELCWVEAVHENQWNDLQWTFPPRQGIWQVPWSGPIQGQESSPSQQRNRDHGQRVANGGHMMPP